MLHLVIPQPKPAAASEPVAATPPTCSVLTPELALTLQVFNSMRRELRAAGIQVGTEVVLDLTLFITAESSDRFAELYQKEWHSPRKVPKDGYFINSVKLRGVKVAWLTPAREVKP
ncbi:hypothetical protein HNP29_002660 [Pseudomonas alcaligenes]|nr:hypothetical protein [Pseudomonas alcaligenes]